VTYPWFAGDEFDAGDANDIHGQILYKTADTTYTGTGLAADPDLFAALEANGVYDVRAFLLINASNAGGVKCQQTGPAASVFPHVLYGTATGGTTFSSVLDHGGTSTYNTDQRAGIGVPDGMYLEGTVIGGVNAGTLTLLFGQVAASGSLIVMKGSRLTVRKVN
jgi:hypothetical protein